MRISVTTIESFRLFLEGDWMTEEALITSIKGEFIPTHRVELGSAFDAVLNEPDPYRVAGGYRCGAFEFGDNVMTPALAVVDRRGVSQVKATTTYGPHTVVCKADQLLGADIVEHKTTLSTFDFDKYAASYQWRFMADIFQPARVTYHVFCLAESTQNGVIELRGIETFHLFPYADLHQDCADLVRRFTEYVRLRHLEGYLQEKPPFPLGWPQFEDSPTRESLRM